MIIEEKINGMVFVEQRTYYIYASEEDRANGHAAILTCSKEGVFIENKKLAKKKEAEGDDKNKFIVS